jgi:hypothetical protein
MILRKISQGRPTNIDIGRSYTVLHEEFTPEHFKTDAGMLLQSEDLRRECYALVIYDNGKEVEPLYRKQQAYIMTDSGQTFENLTLK